MIMIAIVYGAVGILEWRYLRKNKRSIRCVMTLACLWLVMFTGMEVTYAIKDWWSLGLVISFIFEPIQQFLFIGD
ncbi:hypothetical protein [Paenibacillus illinoisensis]|uniref:hypothetical protein n=1 Tax=Paenibacillus illinoisensis TaxID=59845 RepID=UPI00301E1252